MAGLNANPRGTGCAAPSDGAAGSLRRDAAVNRIARSWRELTGGRSRGIDDRERRTLVACSGGADSSALAIALGQVTREIVLGHVVHDLRAPEAAERDRAAAADLAERLGVAFVHEHVRPGEAGGNAEGAARRMRYEALESMARKSRCGYVATAHHAGDELETMLMGLLRGAGPRGLGGVRPSRALSSEVTLIRPMLGVGRGESERICRAYGWVWAVDETNADETRLRACLRARVLPALECVRPGAAVRASRSAGLMREAAEIVAEAAERVLGEAERIDGGLGLRWALERLRGERGVVLGEFLHLAIAEVGGEAGLDRLGGVTIDAILETVREERGEERRFTLRGVEVLVGPAELTVLRREV